MVNSHVMHFATLWSTKNEKVQKKLLMRCRNCDERLSHMKLVSTCMCLTEIEVMHRRSL